MSEKPEWQNEGWLDSSTICSQVNSAANAGVRIQKPSRIVAYSRQTQCVVNKTLCEVMVNNSEFAVYKHILMMIRCMSSTYNCLYCLILSRIIALEFATVNADISRMYVLANRLFIILYI